MRVLLTGGAGYIGSHTALCLLQAGHDVVVLDNLNNSSPEGLRRVAELTGRQAPLIVGDCTDEKTVTRGVCQVSADGLLEKVKETYKLGRDEQGVIHDYDGGQVSQDARTAMAMRSRVAAWQKTDTIHRMPPGLSHLYQILNPDSQHMKKS